MISRKIGYYADLSFDLSSNRKLYIKKLFGKKFAIKSKSAALEHIRLQNDFKKKAVKSGIPIIKSKIEYIGKNENNSHMYLETQPFISTNLKQVLHETENTSYLIKLICQFLLLFKQTWESKFLISLDPVIDNFGLDKKERIVFFDFFPQYQRLSENNFFDWPPALPERRPFILKRHFSEKQAQVIYAQLLRALIKKPILSTQIIKKLIGEYLGSKAFDYIDTNSKKTLKILKNPTIDDADTLRIIAAEFSYEKKLDTAHLEEIFNLTHIFPIKKINLQNNLIKAANIIAKKH